MLAFLTSVLKRSMELPEDLTLLTESVKSLAEEVKYLTSLIVTMATTLQKHSEAIDDLYSVQEFILKNLKGSSSEVKTSALTKSKPQKPN